MSSDPKNNENTGSQRKNTRDEEPKQRKKTTRHLPSLLLSDHEWQGNRKCRNLMVARANADPCKTLKRIKERYRVVNDGLGVIDHGIVASTREMASRIGRMS